MATVKRISGDYVIQTTNAGDTVEITTTVVNVDTTSFIIDGDLTVSGNASLTGNIAGDNIFNGTTNFQIPAPNGSANITVGGVPNVAVFSTGGVNVAGAFTATGNIVGANISTSGTFSVAGNMDGANLNTTGNVWITRDASVGQPTIRFTDTDVAIADGQVLGAVEWFTTNTTGGGPRITSAIRSIASSTLGNANVQILTSTGGAAATAKVTVLSTGNVGIGNVAPVDLLTVQGTIYGSSTATIIGNVTGGNLLTAGSATATGNIQGGNLTTAGLITATGNINGGNIISAGFLGAGTAGIGTVGNITGGNINVVARVSATGNVLGDTITAATAFSTVGNVTAGNVATTELTVSGGAWTTYSPSWTASTSNPAIGDGTITGRFRQLGKTVEVYIRIAMGSTTTFGTGDWRISLPVNSQNQYNAIFNAMYLDNTVQWYQGVAFNGYDGSSTYVTLYYGSTPVSASTPFTWTNADSFIITGTYEGS